MRNIYYPLFVGLALLITGCVKETGDVNQPSDQNPELVQYIFKATVEELTKASISDESVLDGNNADFSWDDGDMIALYNEIDQKFWVFVGDNEGNFSGTATAGADFTTVYYPASLVMTGAEITDGKSASTVNNVYSVNLPNHYESNELSAKAFPMIATVSGTNIPFVHLGSLLKIRINDVPTNATQLKLHSSNQLSGDFTVSSQRITASATESNIIVDFIIGAKQAIDFFIPIPTGTYSYDITLSDGSHTILSKSTTSSKEIAASHLYRMAELTVTYPEASYQLIGHYMYNSAEKNWGDESLVSFSKIDGYYGLYKATVGTVSNGVQFKLYDGTYRGWDWSEDHYHTVGTKLNIQNGAGRNFSIRSNASSLDVYYNSLDNSLFALRAGTSLEIPSATYAVCDDYAFCGRHSDDTGSGFSKDFYLEPAPGSSDWRVVKGITTYKDDANVYRVDFKFRKDAAWSSSFGANLPRWKIANRLITSGQNDVTISNGTSASASYDVYVKNDNSKIFVLTANSSFAVPILSEDLDVFVDTYTLTGVFSHNGNSYAFGDDAYFEEISDNPDWIVIYGVSKSGNDLKFKVRKDKNWGTTYGYSELSPAVPEGFTVSGDGDGNIVISGSGSLDIYLNRSLNSLKCFTAGSTPSL